MIVIKRDKTEEQFDITKIDKAVSKAFKACKKKPNLDVIDCVRNTYDIDSDEKIDSLEDLYKMFNILQIES